MYLGVQFRHGAFFPSVTSHVCLPPSRNPILFRWGATPMDRKLTPRFTSFPPLLEPKNGVVLAGRFMCAFVVQLRVTFSVVQPVFASSEMCSSSSVLYPFRFLMSQIIIFLSSQYQRVRVRNKNRQMQFRGAGTGDHTTTCPVLAAAVIQLRLVK
jgi:hypothetical protein